MLNSTNFHRLRCRAKVGLLGLSTIMILPCAAAANGLGDGVSWQFDTSADKANKAVVADLIEKKRGGYYDGFDSTTTVYSTTNIGSQVNCNNIADAAGNIAENVQGGSAADIDPASSLNSDATGNESTSAFGSDGASGDVDSAQDNTGEISSGIDGSSSSSDVTDVGVGNTAQDLVNDQDNSGNQNAGVDSSTACQLEGGVITGNVDVDGALN